MRVVLTDEARRDLQEIGDYIALDNPRRAASFVRELIASARQIGAAPESFPLVGRYRDLGIRRRVHGTYLIFYRVDPTRVTVIHILHGAREYEALLFPDD